MLLVGGLVLVWRLVLLRRLSLLHCECESTIQCILPVWIGDKVSHGSEWILCIRRVDRCFVANLSMNSEMIDEDFMLPVQPFEQAAIFSGVADHDVIDLVVHRCDQRSREPHNVGMRSAVLIDARVARDEVDVASHLGGWA